MNLYEALNARVEKTVEVATSALDQFPYRLFRERLLIRNPAPARSRSFLNG